MPDCKDFGVVWEVENDCLKVCRNCALSEVSTRREMLRTLASHFDPLGILAPFLLKGKLILSPGQLVLVGDASDIFKRGTYRFGHIHCVHPQQRKVKDIVRRATIAILKDSGTGEIQYILRDLSKIAPV